MENKFVEDYSHTQREEFDFLWVLGTFEIADLEEAKVNLIYKSVFVNMVKPGGEKCSRLCVATYNDKEHGLFTAAPTIRRMSLRFLTSIVSSYGFVIYTRDIKKAFVMSKTVLRQPFFIKPPKELNMQGKVLKVIRPLYGMPESPMHWFKTYLDYHLRNLEMKQSPIYPCLLYASGEENMTSSVSGMVGLQVDDTLSAGTPEFLRKVNENSKQFPNSGRKLIDKSPTRFNGIDIRKTRTGYCLDQKQYVSKIT